MHILIALVLALAVMAGTLAIVLAAGLAFARSAGTAMADGPLRSGLVRKIAFGLLWLLVAGISAGMIGGV